MDIKILDFLIYTTFGTILVPLVLILLDFKRQPQVFMWLAYTLLFSFCCDLAGQILFALGINPNFSNTTYWLFSIFPITIFFYHAIQWRSLIPTIRFVNVVYLIFGIVNFFFIQADGVNSYSNIVHALIIILLSIAFYYKLLIELPAQQLQKLPLFWVVSALFFTNAGKLAIYAVTHYLIHFLKDNLIIVWTFHNFLNIIGNLVIGYGAWLNHKQLRSTSLSL